jgi:hypothetical protein
MPDWMIAIVLLAAAWQLLCWRVKGTPAELRKQQDDVTNIHD